MQLFGGWGEAGQVESGAAEQRASVSVGIERQSLLAELGDDKRIDRSAGAVLGCDSRGLRG